MADDNLEQLVAQGLSAMRAGSDIAADATDDIDEAASDPDLRSLLEEGRRTAREWADRIDRALEEADADDESDDSDDNPVLEAHYEVAERIRDEAPDAITRDLGIIASGQLALHYWIAAFGTMANYLNKLGHQRGAADMKTSADEAKAADQRHTAIAERLLAAG